MAKYKRHFARSKNKTTADEFDLFHFEAETIIHRFWDLQILPNYENIVKEDVLDWINIEKKLDNEFSRSANRQINEEDEKDDEEKDGWYKITH